MAFKRAVSMLAFLAALAVVASAAHAKPVKEQPKPAGRAGIAGGAPRSRWSGRKKYRWNRYRARPRATSQYIRGSQSAPPFHRGDAEHRARDRDGARMAPPP